MGLLKALLLEDLPKGTMKEVEINEEQVLLIHQDEGVYAVNGVCTHARVHLAGGWIEDGKTLCCPKHGGKFDIATGKAVAFPAFTSLATYKVTVEEGVIFVELDE